MPCLFWYLYLKVNWLVLWHCEMNHDDKFYSKILLHFCCLLNMVDHVCCSCVLYLEGHTTMTCPHRVATEHGVIPAPHKNTQNPVEFIFERQLRPGIASVSFEFSLFAVTVGFLSPLSAIIFFLSFSTWILRCKLNFQFSLAELLLGLFRWIFQVTSTCNSFVCQLSNIFSDPFKM